MHSLPSFERQTKLIFYNFLSHLIFMFLTANLKLLTRLKSCTIFTELYLLVRHIELLVNKLTPNERLLLENLHVINNTPYKNLQIHKKTATRLNHIKCVTLEGVKVLSYFKKKESILISFWQEYQISFSLFLCITKTSIFLNIYEI